MSGALKLDLDQGVIENAIAVALAEALEPERRDAMIRDIVRAHMNVKEKSYDKETVLSKAVGDAIRKFAMEAVRDRVAELEPQVKAVVRESLGASFENTVFAQLRESLARVAVGNMNISVTFYDQD